MIPLYTHEQDFPPYQERCRATETLKEDGSHAPQVCRAIIALSHQDFRSLCKYNNNRENRKVLTLLTMYSGEPQRVAAISAPVRYLANPKSAAKEERDER